MNNFNLKYLYRVVYKDGTLYDQNVKDTSVNHSNKSCWSDITLDDIRYFTLSDGIHSYTLDLKDGGFSINGSAKFYLHDEPLTDIKIIHFRRVTMSIVDDHRSMDVLYILGYEAHKLDGTKLSKFIV